jgi:amino-acid N-acetyltransferase
VTVIIHNAQSSDIPIIKKILSQYVLETELVDNNLDQFIVAQNADMIVGCACLHITREVVELRSIAVLPGWKNKGIGRTLFETLKIRAKYMTTHLYVRTTARSFFEKMGCVALDASQKAMIWQDCACCDMLELCTQVPMVLKLG